MKVLHVITGLNDGGAEAVLYRLVAHDSADIHHVISLSSAGKYAAKLRDVGCEVTVLGMSRGRITIKGVLCLWRTLRAWQPDIVQTWMYHADLIGGLAAKLAGIPVVWGIRHTTLDPQRSPRMTIWVAKVCARLSHRVPEKILACAEAARTVHAALGYDNERITVISNGYDLKQLEPDAAGRARLRANWQVSDDCPVLGMVGRFDPQKDHENLIAALGRLRLTGAKFQVMLVGTGMHEDNRVLADWLTAAGLSQTVRLLGPRNDIPAVMSALDVHVLSSAFGEAFPNVLAEAMACGTPCITTDVGDAARITGGTGWVVSPKAPEALAEKLSLALQEWTDRRQWNIRQRSVRQRIKNEFGVDTMVKSYRRVWGEVVGTQA